MATASVRPFSSKNTLSSLRKGQRDGFPQPSSVILTDILGSGTYATVYKGIRKVCIIYNRTMHDDSMWPLLLARVRMEMYYYHCCL